MSYITETQSSHNYSTYVVIPKNAKKVKSTWNYFIDVANTVCSRESTYRTALDVVAFDAPNIFSDVFSFRGIKKTLESVLEGLCSTVSVYLAPQITSYVGKIVGNFILPKQSYNNTINYLRFNMNELENLETFKKGMERIKEEETKDKNFVASLYHKMGKEEKAKKYQAEAEEIKRFCNNFKPNKIELALTRKLKKYTIIGESILEGGWWGGYGLLLRYFRKNILQADRFTGTQGYLSDTESEQLGETGDMTLFQKIIGITSIFISPIVNIFLLRKTENKKAVENNKFLQIAKDQLDMTHGIYPKLGLLFTYTTVPKWIGIISLSQGWLERGERILKLCTVIPSWWLGHRVTNGLFALSADKKLKEKYNTKGGILVEPSYFEGQPEKDSWFVRLTKKFPEPARIHHVMKASNYDPKLQAEAEDLHAKSLYKGFLSHSFGVFALNMGVNQIMKLIALKTLER